MCRTPCYRGVGGHFARYPLSSPILSLQILLPEIWVLPIILVSMPRSFSFTHFSRLLSSSGQGLCSQRKHVNISSPCCPSHHGNHSQHVYIWRAPGSQHAQTSWTENSTVCWRMEVLACPVALKVVMVLLGRYIYLPSFVPTSVLEIQTQTHSWLNCLISRIHERIHRGRDTPDVSKWEQIYCSFYLQLFSIWQWSLNQKECFHGNNEETKSQVAKIKSHVFTIPSVWQHFSPKRPRNCTRLPFIIYNCLIFFWDEALFKSPLKTGCTSAKGHLNLPCNLQYVKCHYVTSPQIST
jgi:hypothetical protein